jgi:hypothetical protein
MFDDDVLAGVRAAREAFAAAHDFDLEKMVAALQVKNESDRRPVVSLPHRPLGNDLVNVALVASEGERQ